MRLLTKLKTKTIDNIIRTRLSVNERPVRRLIAKLNKWADTLVKGGDDEWYAHVIFLRLLQQRTSDQALSKKELTLLQHNNNKPF